MNATERTGPEATAPGLGCDSGIEAIIAAERELRILQAAQLDRIARYAMNSGGGIDGRYYGEFADDELALALNITGGAAGNLLRLAVNATCRLPTALRAMESGDLDLRSLHALAEVTTPLDEFTAHQVEAYVMDRADGKNASQLRQVANRAVARFDPHGVEQRHHTRTRDRRVEFQPLEDGMAELRAYLTAPDATLIKLRLDAHAKAMPPDDDRTTDQRRADTLRDLLLNRAAGPIKTTVHVTIPANILTDTTDTAAAYHHPNDGDYPISPDFAQAKAALHAAHATGNPINHSRALDQALRRNTHRNTDHSADETAAAVTQISVTDAPILLRRNSSGPQTPAARHVCPNPSQRSTPAHRFEVVRPHVDGQDAPATPESYLGGASAVAMSECDGSAASSERPVARGGGPGRSEDHSRWWVAAPQAAELAGYGTITASQARELAAGADATWRRILTDPASGTVLDVGRTSYAPPAALADFVRARDRHCVFPGCRRPADRCDLDHQVPYPKGPTSAANLALLCRHHHRLKHKSGWRVHRQGDGSYRWTSPAEIEYVSRPEPIVDQDPPAELDFDPDTDPYEDEPPPF